MTEKGEITTIQSLYKWEIPNVCFNCEEVNKQIFSPLFTAHGVQWQIHFYPKGHSEQEQEYLSFFLYLQSSTSTINISYQFAILNRENKIVASSPSMVMSTFYKEKRGLGYQLQFMKYSTRIDKSDQILNDGKLTIICKTSTSLCKITEYEDNEDSKEDENNISNYEKYFSNETLSDMQFIIDEEIIPAHKFVLASRSEVFAAMFLHNMKENNEGKVRIEDCDPKIFKEMLRYIYTGKVDDGIENIVDDVLLLSDKYLLSGLKRACENYLMKNLSKENIFDCVIVAKKYNLLNLKKKSIKFIVSNSTELLKSI